MWLAILLAMVFGFLLREVVAQVRERMAILEDDEMDVIGMLTCQVNIGEFRAGGACPIYGKIEVGGENIEDIDYQTPSKGVFTKGVPDALRTLADDWGRIGRQMDE